MILDAIIGVAAIFAFYRGWNKGLIAAILSLVGMVLGVLLALKLSTVLATYLSSHNIISANYILPLSFIIIVIATIFLIKMLTKMLEGVLKAAMLGWVNKLIGGLVFTIVTLFVASTILMLGNNLGIITPDAKQASKTIAFIEPIAPYIITKAGDLVPVFKNLMEQVKVLSNFNIK
jgi:membrane protein required for colicin V production